jgi:hypothetical protein
MSGLILARLRDRILMLSDGGLYRSTADFTMTGQTGKISKYTHLSAVMGSVGKAIIRVMIDVNCAQDWRSFDHMVEVMRENAQAQLHGYRLMWPESASPIVVVAFGGWSTTRERWESYTLQIQDWAVSELQPSPEVFMAPLPDAAALTAQGFDPAAPAVTDDDDFVRLMLAQRSTPALMGAIGDDADSAASGYTVGAFIERVRLQRQLIVSDIPVRWPDEVGKMIDLSNEAVFQDVGVA